MTKLNPTTMKTQYDGQYDTFCRKNHDYGNSFEESLDQFGIVASIVRMGDKMKRLESLTDDSKTQQVGSESLLDTLEDLSNYAAMTACWLKGVQAEDDVINKSYHAVKDLIEKCDDSDVMDAYKYNIQDMQDTMKFWKKPGTPFTPLGPEIMDDHSLQEALFNNYIKETVDECANRIHQLSIRGEIPTKGGIEHYTYKLGRLAMEHYKDPEQIIEHVNRMNSFRSLDDKYAKLVVDSIKEYIQNFNKEKEFKESNSKKIVVFGRASGKNMAVMRSLLKDLGLSREAIREIFDEMEEDDE
jgi:phage protein